MATPDLFQRCLGFRQFKLAPKGDKLVLKSCALDYAWEPGVNKAVCKANSFMRVGEMQCSYPDHDAPDLTCDCGLYSYHDCGPSDYGQHLPWAAVQGWGRMQVHPNGFRAEYAQVVLLGVDAKPRHKAVFALAEEYGLRIVKPQELVEAAKDYGEPVPESLRPEMPEGAGAITINMTVATESLMKQWAISSQQAVESWKVISNE